MHHLPPTCCREVEVESVMSDCHVSLQPSSMPGIADCEPLSAETGGGPCYRYRLHLLKWAGLLRWPWSPIGCGWRQGGDSLRHHALIRTGGNFDFNIIQSATVKSFTVIALSAWCYTSYNQTNLHILLPSVPLRVWLYRTFLFYHVLQRIMEQYLVF